MPGSISYTIPNLTTQGPAYATEVSNALGDIQTHTHDGVNEGALIDISIQQCNNDLSVNGHNLSNTRSTEYVNNPAALSGSQDVLCVYVNQGNLYYNTDDGTPVQLTDGAFPAPSAASTLNWIMRTTVTAAFSVLPTDDYNFVPINSSGGTITGTLPIAANITAPEGAAGRLYVFKDVGGAAATHPITIQVAPASGNTFGDSNSTSFVINNNYGYVAFYVDAGLQKWFVWDSNVLQGTTLQANAASAVVINGSSLTVENTSTVALDATSEMLVVGSLVSMLGATFNLSLNTVMTMLQASQVFHNTSTQTFNSGTSSEFQSGASLNLDAGSTTTAAGALNVTGTETVTGTLALSSGSTTTSAGTLNVTGTTSITGSTTINGVTNIQGSSTTIVGGATLNVNGEIAGSGSALILNQGTTNMYGEIGRCVVPGNGNYTADGSGFDNAIGLRTSLGGPFAIFLPASPSNGRRIRIFSAGAVSLPVTVTINGGSYNVMGTNSTSTNLTFVSYYAPGTGTITQFAVELVFDGTEWACYSALNVQV